MIRILVHTRYWLAPNSLWLSLRVSQLNTLSHQMSFPTSNWLTYEARHPHAMCRLILPLSLGLDHPLTQANGWELISSSEGATVDGAILSLIFYSSCWLHTTEGRRINIQLYLHFRTMGFLQVIIGQFLPKFRSHNVGQCLKSMLAIFRSLLIVMVIHLIKHRQTTYRHSECL